MTDQDIEIARLVLDYIKVLVWPLTIILLVGMFEHEFVFLIRRLIKWNAPGFSAEFSATAEQVEQTTERAVAAGQAVPIPDPPGVGWVLNAELKRAGLTELPGGFDFERYKLIAQSDPNLALAGLRIDFEITLRNLAQAYDITVSKPSSLSFLVTMLVKAEALRKIEAEAIKSILSACNRAVHGEKVLSADALKVIESGELLILSLADTAMSKVIA
ncbi:MAG: hypothetical protein CVT79_15475 [Alphaproteobacteria bacterium HGW-Alphaproteobacteria-18]|nr:MAG: hypothetical protein CVT79_15475 [Alphaproteobacteria bacterium HGW-Alphaproteobacteria-18]